MPALLMSPLSPAEFGVGILDELHNLALDGNVGFHAYDPSRKISCQ